MIAVMSAALAATIAASVSVVSASACGPGTQFALSLSTGPAGTSITGSGVGFASTLVTFHWGSPTGVPIGVASGPSFSKAAITIPQVASGYYFIDAWDGANALYVSAPFVVTAPMPTPPPAAPAPGPPTALPVVSPSPSTNESAPTGPPVITHPAATAHASASPAPGGATTAPRPTPATSSTSARPSPAWRPSTAVSAAPVALAPVNSDNSAPVTGQSVGPAGSAATVPPSVQTVGSSRSLWVDVGVGGLFVSTAAALAFWAIRRRIGRGVVRH